MSYDLAVYTREALPPGELAGLVRELVGLDVDTEGLSPCPVVRGARRRYSFTIGGPDAVEPEDIPTEVTAAVLGPKFLWTVAVEGTIASEIPHASRFARRLAQALDGAVFDPQEDAVWTRSKSRSVTRPARDERVSTAELRLYCRSEDVPENAALRYVQAASTFLPEALPRRFGDHEPLQGKWAEGGADSFQAAWRTADMMLSFAGSGPCIGGNLYGVDDGPSPDRFWSLSVNFHRAPLMDERWRNAIRHLFIALTDRLPVFYGSMEVIRNWEWSGRSLWADEQTEWGIHPLVGQPRRWAGLPPIPTWWTWLGGTYQDLAPRLPPDGLTRTARGLLYEASSLPSDRDQLTPLQQWLPQDLFATLEPNPREVRPAPLKIARRIPPELRV